VKQSTAWQMLFTFRINLELLALKSESPIERQILDYLSERPTAQDTLRGIAEWWLLKQTIAQTTAEVEAAVTKLVAEGKLSVRTGPDGRVHYYKNRTVTKEGRQKN
jgi:hypothetical protein